MAEDQRQSEGRLRPELTLERMKALCTGYLPGLIGMELVSVSSGKILSRLNVRHDLMAPNGFLHAATIIGLADTSCGFGTLAHLPEGAKSFTTLELKTNFVSTVRGGAITCEATLEHFGRTVQVWDAVVADEATARTIALFRCTQMILWPKH